MKQPDTKQLKWNIQILYLFRALRSFTIVIAVIVPFFQERGLSQSQIFALQSMFAAAMIIFEVPSGYFADTIGRKRSLVVGAGVLSLGFLMYSFSYGFFTIAVAEVLLGIGYSFISGADEALAYESMKALDRASRYKLFEARSQTIMSVSEGAASVLGGLVAIVSLRAPIVAQLGTEFLLVLVALSLVEPPHVKKIDVHPLADVLRVTKYALHDHSEVKWLIFYSALVATISHTAVWLIQPYYQLAGVPIGWFGVLWATQMFAMGLFAHNAIRYERWLGRRRALISFPIIGVTAYVVLGVFPAEYALPAILGFYFIFGVHTPILKHYINELIESDMRATILSVKSLAQKLLYAGLGPLIGVVVDAYSLRTGLLFSAAIYGLLSLFVVGAMKRKGMV